MAVGILAATMTGCGGGGDSSPDRAAEPQSVERADVPWDDYAPGVQRRVDQWEARKSCARMQGEFDVAFGNNDATLSRTGHGNAELMAYIDEALKSADCY